MTSVHVFMPDGPANPGSLGQAIRAFAPRPERKIAVLGDMPGLGADELAQHAALAEPLADAGFSRVFTVGECMRALRGALPRSMRAAHADSADMIEEPLRSELADGDCLLVKGWDGTEFGALVARLQGEVADHVV